MRVVLWIESVPRASWYSKQSSDSDLHPHCVYYHVKSCCWTTKHRTLHSAPASGRKGTGKQSKARDLRLTTGVDGDTVTSQVSVIIRYLTVAGFRLWDPKHVLKAARR